MILYVHLQVSLLNVVGLISIPSQQQARIKENIQQLLPYTMAEYYIFCMMRLTKVENIIWCSNIIVITY